MTTFVAPHTRVTTKTTVMVTVPGFGIVIPSLSDVRPNLIGFRDEFKLDSLVAIPIVAIRVQLHNELAIRRFDFLDGTAGSDL